LKTDLSGRKFSQFDEPESLTSATNSKAEYNQKNTSHEEPQHRNESKEIEMRNIQRRESIEFAEADDSP
jgi:hypothetical protein